MKREGKGKRGEVKSEREANWRKEREKRGQKRMRWSS